jgi:hypothetical protein
MPDALPPGFQIDPTLSQQMGTTVAVNPTTGKRIRWNAAPSGDAFLKSLDPATATQVRALSEGRMAFPTGMALSKPYWQQMLSNVAQYDPNFDVANPASRTATRKDFTSGKAAQNITALNTVVGHLDHLDRAIDGLGNYSGDEPGPIGIPLGPLARTNNVFARKIADMSGTGQRYKDFEAAKTAVANELTRVFRGSGGAEADIQGWLKQLDSASSPPELKSVVRSMATLMKSRLEALGEQYQQGLGTSKDPITLLTPDKQAAYRRMLGDGVTQAPAQPAARPGRPALKDIFG